MLKIMEIMFYGPCTCMTVFCLVPFETQENGHKEATQLQTKLCKAVGVVLGTTSEIKSLDQARRCHKRKPNNRDAANDYLNKLTFMQSQVLCKHNKLKKSFDKWERKFFVTYNCLLAWPEGLKNDPTATELMKQIKYASALLKEWKMDGLG